MKKEWNINFVELDNISMICGKWARKKICLKRTDGNIVLLVQKRELNLCQRNGCAVA